MPDQQVDPEAQRRQLMAAAMAQKLPIAVLDPTCNWTPDRDSAAVTALNNAAAENRKYELGGAIFQNKDGLYCYSIPVGDKHPGDITFGVKPSKDATLAAIYHTHPVGGAELDTFSPGDVETAKALKVASYIKSLENDVVKRLDPESIKTVWNPGTFKSKTEGVLVSPPRTAAK